MIITIISFLLLFWTIYNSYTLFKKDPSFIKKIYLTNVVDYFFGAIIFFLVLSVIIFLPKLSSTPVLSFSWLNLFDAKGSNLIVQPINTSGKDISKFLAFSYSTVMWLIFTLCLPYLAKVEEEIFREYYFDHKSRIKQSLKFGFIHMIVGVPVFVAIILSIVGWIFSIRYCLSFNKNLKSNSYSEACDRALFDSTSLHAKYNFIIITSVYLASIIFLFYK
jgi:hypothetical protein